MLAFVIHAEYERSDIAGKKVTRISVLGKKKNWNDRNLHNQHGLWKKAFYY